MRIPRVFSSCSVLMLLIAAVASSAERPIIPATLTLRQAIEIALAQSPSLLAAMTRVEQAQAQARRGRSPLLPQISIEAYESGQTANLKALGIDTPLFRLYTDPFETFDARLVFSQDIVNALALRRFQALSQGVQTWSQRVKDTRDTVILATIEAYLAASRDVAYRKVVSGQLKLAADLLELNQSRFRQGVGSALDVNRATQEWNRLRELQMEADGATSTAKLNLANVIHAQPSDAFEPEDISALPEPVVPKREEAVSTALQSRADYQAAQTQVRNAELSIRVASAGRLPVLRIRADAGFNGNNPTSGIATYRLFGLVSIPIFTGGAISAEVDEARSKANESRILADEIQAKVESEVLIALAELDTATRRTAITQESVRLAQEELDLALQRLKSGVADNVDVVTAQGHLLLAENDKLQNAFAVRLRGAQLSRAQGSLEPAGNRP